jgi:hypothetical protein
MDSSSRQVNCGSFEGSDKVEVQASEKVAIVANLKKVGCDELTPEEWVELINIALIYAKPHFRYLPFFLPTKDKKICRFHFSRNFSGGVHHVKCCWSEETFDITNGGETPFETLAKAKVIQLCEVACPPELETSARILMDTHGAFFYVSCIYQNGNFKPPMIRAVQTICGREPLIDAIKHYPQIGPRALFAISTMVSETYKKKLEVLKELDSLGKTLGAICANVEVKGHYVEKHPWGVSDGSNKPVDEYRY